MIDPSKWHWWILILIVFRVPVTYKQTYEKVPVDACIQYRFDMSDYICPVENFLANGRWEPDLRLPGYSIIYLLFRSFLPMWYALFSMIVLQVLVGCVAAYLLAKSAYEVSGSKIVFIFIFLLFGLNKYMCFYDGYVISDSLSQNLIAISVYFFSSFYLKREKIFLFYSGLLLGWTAFMRPANVFAFPAGLIAIYILDNKNLIRFMSNAVTYCLSYVVLITSFFSIYYLLKGDIYRVRYQEHFSHDFAQKLLVVHGTLCWPNMEIDIFPPEIGQNCNGTAFMVGVFGNEHVVKNSKLYLLPTADQKMYKECFYKESADPIREYLLRCSQTVSFSVDSLLMIREILKKMVYADGKEFDSLEKVVDSKLGLYIRSVKQEKPLYYYFTSRVKSFIWLITNGQWISSGHSSIVRFIAYSVLILFHTLPLYLYLILFVPILIFSFIRKDKEMLSLLVFTLSGIIITLSYIVVSLPQVRYLASAYPYLFWGLALELHYLYSYANFRRIVS